MLNNIWNPHALITAFLSRPRSHLTVLLAIASANWSSKVTLKKYFIAGRNLNDLRALDQPKPPQIQNIKPDSNSVRITWQDDAGCSQITSHWLAVTSGSPRSTYELADCVQDIAGFSSVNTSQCLPQLQLSPCTGYQFQILAEIDGTSTLRSDPVNVTTLPSKSSIELG